MDKVMKLGKELALEAQRNGICSEWFDAMKNLTDKKALLEMYVKGIDFCLSNNYPSNDYIREHFKGEMEPFGVHLDEALLLQNPRTVVALGKCSGSIKVDEFTVSEVFIKHQSDLTIKAKGNSFVMVDIFDDAKVYVLAADESKVCINRYGGDVSYDTRDNGIVKIKEKNKKTY